MDKCKIHPYHYVGPETKCPACVSQAALDNVKVMPRKMTMSKERMTKLLSIRSDKIDELEEELYWANWWRNVYGWIAAAGWVCLVIYSAFGGPEV